MLCTWALSADDSALQERLANPPVGVRVGMDPAGSTVAVLDEPQSGNTKTAAGTATLASTGGGSLAS